MRHLLVGPVLLLSFCICLPVYGDSVSDASSVVSAADGAWAEVGDPDNPAHPIDGMTRFQEAKARYGSPSAELEAWVNKVRHRYRDMGLKFWDRYPDDPRRYQWLGGTVWIPPSYWKDSEQGSRMSAAGTPELALIDDDARSAWQRRYMQLRAEFMVAPAPGVDDERRGLLVRSELLQRTLDAQDELRRGGKVDFYQLANQLIEFGSSAAGAASAFWLSPLADVFFSLIQDDTVTQTAFIAALKQSPRKELRDLAEARERMTQLRSKPLDLKLKTLEGGTLDLAGLRGKVVLVDMWGNSCASCIDAMPKLQKVYEKYRKQGFEIAGVWLTPSVEQQTTEHARKVVREYPDRARDILKKQGATWTNGILADPELTQFTDRYSIRGVPQTWLLDQNGLLITTDVSGPRLEAQVRKLLGLQ